MNSELLPKHEGLWFVDHDVFFLAHLEPWLADRDHAFHRSPCCLSYLTSQDCRAIDSPLVWLSLRRLPTDLPGCVEQVFVFYATCPAEWLADEEPVLLDCLDTWRCQ